MIEKNQLQKLLKSIVRHKHDLPDHQIMHPFREWLICLLVTTILLAVLVFFCITLYKNSAGITPQQILPEIQKTTTVLYRSEEVAAGLENFTTRKNTHDLIKQKLEESGKILLPKPDMQTEVPTTTASTSPETTSESDLISTESTTPENTPDENTTLPVSEAI